VHLFSRRFSALPTALRNGFLEKVPHNAHLSSDCPLAQEGSGRLGLGAAGMSGLFHHQMPPADLFHISERLTTEEVYRKGRRFGTILSGPEEVLRKRAQGFCKLRLNALEGAFTSCSHGSAWSVRMPSECSKGLCTMHESLCFYIAE